MLKITFNSRSYIVARHWAAGSSGAATNEVELVDTITCSVQRVPAATIAGALAQAQRVDLTTLPVECGFVPFAKRPRDFIYHNQQRRQQKLLSYKGRKSLYGKATRNAERNADMTSEDSCDEWGQPISKAPKKPRSGSPKGTRKTSVSKLEAKLSSAKQALAQKGLGDLFD